MFLFNFLHTFNPDPILISIGFINIYWYGLFMVLAILAGLAVSLQLAKYYAQNEVHPKSTCSTAPLGYEIKKDLILDLAFVLIISGLIGARVYDVFLELPYYLQNPIDVFKIWQGGLAIHGAIIGGLIGAWIFFRKYNLKNYWQIISIITPGLALGQAIGRWGNYFNQELFGVPTNAPWGIPINILNRPEAYINFEYFHPTFLYESIGSFIIFLILIRLHFYIIKNKQHSSFFILHSSLIVVYLLLYSVLRFSLEFIRIDYAPELLGLRVPQVMSLLIIIIIAIYYLCLRKKKTMLS